MQRHITVGGKEYTLQTHIPDYEPGAAIINEGMTRAKKVLDSEPIAEQLKQIPFDGIFLYDEKEINAFATHEGGTYLIALSYGFFVETYQWIRLWKSAPQINEMFKLDDETKKHYFDNAYWSIIMFVVLHEAYHILNGHCDLPDNRNSFLSEKENLREAAVNLYGQILEYDADCCAVQYCARMLFSNIDRFEVAFHSMRPMGFGLYNIFLLFNGVNDERSKDEFLRQMKRDFSQDNHPNPSIRSVYCIFQITSIAMEYYPEEQVKLIMEILTKDCISFDRIMMEHSRLKDCLYTMAYTEKGGQHIMFLVNEWKTMREILLKYAHIKLREWEALDTFPVWVNDEGDFRTD